MANMKTYTLTEDEWYPVPLLTEVSEDSYGRNITLPEEEAQKYIRAVARFRKARARIVEVIKECEIE